MGPVMFITWDTHSEVKGISWCLCSQGHHEINKVCTADTNSVITDLLSPLLLFYLLLICASINKCVLSKEMLITAAKSTSLSLSSFNKCSLKWSYFGSCMLLLNCVLSNAKTFKMSIHIKESGWCSFWSPLLPPTHYGTIAHRDDPQGLFTERSDNSLLVCGHSFLIRITRVMLRQACFSVFVNQILSLTTWWHIQYCHLLSRVQLK